jgi:hypothetical protein
MKSLLLAKILMVALSVISTFKVNPTQAQGSKNVYTCISNNGVPTTVVDTKRGRIELIVWKSDYFRASDWTPQKRCEEVSSRFQKFSDQGTLRYVTTGVISNQKVICVAKPLPGKGYNCMGDSLLITLQPEDNPSEVLKNLFSNAARVGGTPVTRDPEGKYIFPMNDYLEQAPLMNTTMINKFDSQMVEDKEKTIPRTTTMPSNNSAEEICPPLLCE